VGSYFTGLPGLKTHEAGGQDFGDFVEPVGRGEETRGLVLGVMTIIDTPAATNRTPT
jgi:hypothetical protein